MADELITKTAEQIQAENNQSESEKRIRQLSEKVRLTSEERDEKDKLLKEALDKNANLEKENSFNTGFVDVLSTHSAAKDHKEEIKAKVLAGYSVEDATFAVLGKAGKLGGTPIAPVTQNPAGGSASTTLPQGGTKSPSEMTQEERHEILKKDLIWS